MFYRYILIVAFVAIFPRETQGIPLTKSIYTPSELDTDEDGVPDNKDFCPDVQGPKSNKGCPENITPPPRAFIQDRDRDGVDNTLDACPDIPGSEADGGCPPKFFFSSQNIEVSAKVADFQPSIIPVFKTLERANEPNTNNPHRDADHDGIRNKEDRCPFTKGTKSLQGCPELSSADNEILAAVRNELIFERGNANLATSGLSVLETLSVMLTLPYASATATFSIYADEMTFQEDNANLTYARGKAIKKFLLDRGVEPEHLRFQYFGDMRPPANYSWNPKERSRVEVTLLFP